MKFKFILIFLITSLFAFSAMEKTSFRYSSDLETEVEVEFSEVDDINGKDYTLHFVKVTEIHYRIESNHPINNINKNFSLDHEFSTHSSLNRIYFPQGPPVLV